VEICNPKALTVTCFLQESFTLQAYNNVQWRRRKHFIVSKNWAGEKAKTAPEKIFFCVRELGLGNLCSISKKCT
jgi:hypothetical protein